MIKNLVTAAAVCLTLYSPVNAASSEDCLKFAQLNIIIAISRDQKTPKQTVKQILLDNSAQSQDNYSKILIIELVDTIYKAAISAEKLGNAAYDFCMSK